MLLVAVARSDKEKDLLLECIRAARKRFGYHAVYVNGRPLEDPDTLAVEVVQEDPKSGKREIVLERLALHISGVNDILGVPVVQKMLREGRFRIWTPEKLWERILGTKNERRH